LEDLNNKYNTSITEDTLPPDGILHISGDLKDSGTRREFTGGAVRDAEGGKGRYDLIPSIPIFFLARVYEMGAKKYADRNWEKGMPINVFVDCAKRHLDKYQMGLRDEPHLSQALWNIVGALFMAAMVHLGLRDTSFNNLPNHVGEHTWKGQEQNKTIKEWKAPPLSPMEIKSLETFGLTRSKDTNERS